MGKGSQTVEEGNQLLPSALGAQGQGDGRQTSDGVEAEDDIVVLCIRLMMRVSGGWNDGEQVGDVAYLELVDEDGDGVELVVRIRRVSHGERCGLCEALGLSCRMAVLEFRIDGGM